MRNLKIIDVAVHVSLSIYSIPRCFKATHSNNTLLTTAINLGANPRTLFNEFSYIRLGFGVKIFGVKMFGVKKFSHPFY